MTLFSLFFLLPHYGQLMVGARRSDIKDQFLFCSSNVVLWSARAGQIWRSFSFVCSAVCQLLLGVVVLEEMLEEGRKSEACMRV